MNRETTEARLKELILEAWKVYKEYNQDGRYLTMTISWGHIMVSNSHYERDAHSPIDFIEPLPREEANG